MVLTRREFGKRTVAVVMGAGAATELLSGFACNTQSVFTTINGILLEVGPALQIILQLLPLLSSKSIPATVQMDITDWVQEVTRDSATLQSLITQYKNDIANNPAVQDKINAALATTAQDLSSILPMIHVLDAATVQKITEIELAVAAGIVSVETLIHQIEGNVAVKMPPTVHGKLLIVRNGKGFKKTVNDTVLLPTGDVVVDAATKKVKKL